MLERSDYGYLIAYLQAIRRLHLFSYCSPLLEIGNVTDISVVLVSSNTPFQQVRDTKFLGICHQQKASTDRNIYIMRHHERIL